MMTFLVFAGFPLTPEAPLGPLLRIPHLDGKAGAGDVYFLPVIQVGISEIRFMEDYG